MKLSRRLKHIDSMVAPGYTHIWDCCCDHGLLGARLLSRQAASHIHFVDVLPELIEQLNDNLRRYYPTARAGWHTHCLDAAALPLEQYAGKQLIIIAGVGGDLMTRLILAIHQQHPQAHLDFLLCPVHQEYNLRQQLISLNFSLIHEALVKDNKRFYEVLLVRTTQQPAADRKPISAVGEWIWQADTIEQARIAEDYLSKTLTHYQRIQNGNVDEIQTAISAYRAVTISSSAELRQPAHGAAGLRGPLSH